MISHSCIKCGVKYEDKDTDDFYCPSCTEGKKAIAKKIDAQIRPSKKIKNELQVYDEIRRATGMRFPPAKSLGII